MPGATVGAHVTAGRHRPARPPFTRRAQRSVGSNTFWPLVLSSREFAPSSQRENGASHPHAHAVRFLVPRVDKRRRGENFGDLEVTWDKACNDTTYEIEQYPFLRDGGLDSGNETSAELPDDDNDGVDTSAPVAAVGAENDAGLVFGDGAGGVEEEEDEDDEDSQDGSDDDDGDDSGDDDGDSEDDDDDEDDSGDDDDDDSGDDDDTDSGDDDDDSEDDDDDSEDDDDDSEDDDDDSEDDDDDSEDDDDDSEDDDA